MEEEAVDKEDAPLVDAVERCMRQLLGLELVLRWSELHREARWTICPLMFSPRGEYAAFMSCSYDFPLASEDMNSYLIQRRCNVRFKSKEEATIEILTRIVDFSWCNADCIAIETLKNPLLGKTSVEELEILLDLSGDREHA